jgi:hypothetical protein
MKKEKRQFWLIKEEEKIRQVTHWDLDYLPTKEILDLYQRKSSTEHVTDESNRKLSLLLIASGLLLLAGTLFVMSLV